MQLTSQQLDVIKNIFINSVNQSHQLYLYGSRAKNTAWKFSDIDLCIDGDVLTYKDVALIKEKFSESNLPYFVDFVQKQNLSIDFFNLIEPDFIKIPLH